MKDEKRLQDILDAISSIEIYSVSDYETFLEDEKTQDAILYNLIVIGEAANEISKEFREKFPAIPWSSIIGTRNIVAHGYDHVKLEIVWKILQEDLSALKEEIISAMGEN
ncbi:MAG TPA: DUF86 domain-containing protein [Chloroflexi bacterium]|nr:MAG: hypothetical protein DRI65_01135 [Chloroflexota bacterium]HDN04760.1 DUF86 domain-containing protein [Chloroflexota bacterium]